jgi:hypothetical protein
MPGNDAPGENDGKMTGKVDRSGTAGQSYPRHVGFVGISPVSSSCLKHEQL